MAAVSDDDGSHGRSQVPRCAQHNEELKYHCRTCKEILCAQCTTAEKHRGHEIVLLDTAGVLALLSSDAGRLRAALPATTLAIDRLHTTSGDVGLEMERVFADLRALLDSRERECQRAFDTAAREPLTTLRGAHQTAQRALEDAERIATQPVGSTQFGEALSVWRGVHDALIETERATATAVPCRVVWAFSAPQLTEIRDAIARIPRPFLHFGVSFRDGPNYAVSGTHRNVLTKNGGQHGAWDATAVGERTLPRNCKTRFAFKIVRTGAIMIGVAPPTINQGTANNHVGCGWYFYAHNSQLYAGPPQNFRYKPCGQLSGSVPDGKIVEVEADMEHGTLSFTVDGKCGGIAFEGLPADIVPVVLFYHLNDSVEVVWP